MASDLPHTSKIFTFLCFSLEVQNVLTTLYLKITCAFFLIVLLQFIPMPVLYGVFLYMGASSLKGIQVNYFIIIE